MNSEKTTTTFRYSLNAVFTLGMTLLFIQIIIPVWIFTLNWITRDD